MAKRISVKVGEYQKDGKTVGRYQEVGVILPGEHGEFVLLDPSINMAGVLLQQNLLNPDKPRDRVMAGIWENDSNTGKKSSQAAPDPVQAGPQDFDDSIPF